MKTIVSTLLLILAYGGFSCANNREAETRPITAGRIPKAPSLADSAHKACLSLCVPHKEDTSISHYKTQIVECYLSYLINTITEGEELAEKE